MSTFSLAIELPEVINMQLLPTISIHCPANRNENTQTYRVEVRLVTSVGQREIDRNPHSSEP